MQKSIQIGDVITVQLPKHDPQGHEQQGFRPAVVAGLPAKLGKTRFPTLLIVPLTTDREQPWARVAPDLYPQLPAQAGGLPVASIALLDQVRAIDQSRVYVRKGSLAAEHYRAIRAGLKRMMELDH